MSHQVKVDSMVWLQDLQRRALDILLTATVVLGTVGMLVNVWRVLSGQGAENTLPYYTAAYLFALGLLLARRIPNQWRVAAFLVALYAFSCLALNSGWLVSSGRQFLLAAMVAAAVLISPRAGSVFAVLSLVTFALFGVAFNQGWLVLDPLPSPLDAPPILTEGVGFSMTVGIVGISFWFFRQALSMATQATGDAQQARALLDERAQQLDKSNQLLVERTRNAESARREAEANRQAIEAQMWQAAGLAQLNDILRGEQDILALATLTIQHLCRYLDLPVGVLYVRQGDQLELMGSYAYTHRKMASNRFRIGEGMVGQAALEKQTIVLTRVPRDYVTLTSGLVQLTPQNILVSPILHEGQVIGVVELGAIAEFSPEQVAFLERSLESVAIVFNTAQARRRIDELLTQTQQQAAELQTREGELRAVNQELQSQAATLRVQQSELEAANTDLEEKAAVLQEQRTILDQQNRDLKTAQRELERRTEDLAQANKYKSEFLANMSHELRTPLNSLLILARLLTNNHEGNLTAEQVESARIIYNSGSDLLALINEILDLSKVEAGRMEFHFAPLPLADLAASMRAQFEPVAKEKNLAFDISVADDLPPTIEADQQRLEQIVKNLLSNAFKFTDEGYVRLEIRRPDERVNLSQVGLRPDQTVAICVLDSGIGMTAEQQKIVFEAFKQANGSTSRKYGGTGLGLTISRELAMRLGGQLGLQSEPGRGSVFTLYLPFSQQQRKPQAGLGPALTPATQAIAPPSPAQIAADDRDDLHDGDKILLVVEDDANFARTVCHHAHNKGFKCLIAGDGESGLELAKAYRPDAIILDLKLPGMSGWDVLDALKRDSDTRHIPVHVMSALDENLDAYKMGAMGFLTKPVTPQALDTAFQRIEALISQEIRSLLVVEDDANLRHSVAQLLGGSDVQISEAEQGQVALDLLQSQQFDCMILDLSLPDMSGFEVLNRMHTQETIYKCPVIVYTGQDLTEEENQELIKYADSVIVKGVKSPERLLDETALFLHQVVADLPEEKRQTIKQLHDREAALAGKQILVVDDDMRSAFALSKLLGDKGLKVTIARNGAKAMELLDTTAGIDLVLMDIMMPDMDGYETIERIRAQRRFRSLPILALTAKAMKGDQDKCIAAGANDYLSKPVDADRLFSMLRVWLYR